ncbi:MAG: SDR family oxidoreductase [Spirochaetia bacterium]
MRFKDKVVIITGASQGLGVGYARDFLKEGARVVLVARRAEKLEQVASKLAAELAPQLQLNDAERRILPVACDVSDEQQVQTMVRRVLDEFGTVDVLINNAALHISKQVIETSKAEWDRQIGINLTGTFLCTREVLPLMIRKSYGKIVNISSSAAKHFFPGFGAYAASKGGIVSFTHTLSEEVKQFGINVNAVYLGMTNTEYTRQRIDSDPAVSIDLDEMLQVDEVSKVVLFLASDEAAPVMGAALDVFGKKA